MVTVDSRLERIARRLTLADLRSDDDDDDGDLLAARQADWFVDVYSPSGLRHAFYEYGITSALAARGLADHRLLVTREDPFRHRLQLLLDDGGVIMDLRLHLVDAAVAKAPHEKDSGDKNSGDKNSGDNDRISVVVVDWLLMQNPRAAFSTARPRLPGQEHPGTGLGGQVHQLLILLCRRLGRDGLVNTPERFHLAALYRRLGYVGDAHDDAIIAGVVAAAARQSISLPLLAWAVDRGFVNNDAGKYRYAPHELFCPVSKRLERALAHPPAAPQPGFVVDVDGLHRSLRHEPVAGLDEPSGDGLDGGDASG